ncbi:MULTISPECIES: peptidase inhibitor family I36 protein [unclassified Streptomyces]|uniref:peptidase inhibitor family I36 protein n=1 Tax=unclassified Streptomyces TaxID=2593676 RepID=UPI001F1F5ED1|nr:MULTISPECIES: peptidase inhibitor family I36 protein [unclassified Streptomyces]
MAAAAAVLAAGASVLAVGPASAKAAPASAAATTTCSSGYACIYYHPNYGGAFFRQFPSIPNYSGYTFTASANGSDGAGQGVRNNAASVDNWDFVNSFTVYYHPNYTGASQTFAAGGGGNFNTTLRNENASGCFGSC